MNLAVQAVPVFLLIKIPRLFLSPDRTKQPVKKITVRANYHHLFFVVIFWCAACMHNGIPAESQTMEKFALTSTMTVITLSFLIDC